MNYHYTFVKGSEYITAKGSGDDPHDLKGIKWVSSPNASGVLKQVMQQESGYSPSIGFVTFKKFPNDFYVQIARFGSIYKDGWRFKDTNLPAIPAESTELGKAKTKKRVYVKASSGRKAHYRTQEVGREEVAPVENLWEITADQFGRLVSGSKIPLQAKYIEDFSYKPNEPHPKLEHLVGLMDDHMQSNRIPFLDDFVNPYAVVDPHTMAVNRAASEHKPVPLSVLKDYPEVVERYGIDISDEALAQEPPQGEIKHLHEMLKDEYDAIIGEVKKDYESDPLKITDAMLKRAYPQELEDTKRAAKMRKKIFDKLPKQFKNGYCPETMNLHLHADVVQYAAVYGFDISPEVKQEYPMLFKGVPINFSPTGDKESDDAINAILKDVRDRVLKSVSGVGSMGEIHNAAIDSIGSTGESVNAEVAVADPKAGGLISTGMVDISYLVGPKLLQNIKDSGVNIRIKYHPERNRSNFVNEDSTINLSKGVLNTDSMTYSDSTICHEYGHGIEHMVPEVKSLCGEFLDRRTRDDAMTLLNDVCPGMGYGDDEVTRVDRFMSPYIGKHYSDRCTEVLSMGMGYLTSATDIQQMYIEDPEYWIGKS
jgi:hypothetical protein